VSVPVRRLSSRPVYRTLYMSRFESVGLCVDRLPYRLWCHRASVMGESMSMGHWWTDNGRGKVSTRR